MVRAYLDLPSAADPDDAEPAVSVDVPADAPVVELPGCSLLVADSLISSVDGLAVSCRHATAHKQNTMHALRMRKSSAKFFLWKRRWKYGGMEVPMEVWKCVRKGRMGWPFSATVVPLQCLWYFYLISSVMNTLLR